MGRSLLLATTLSSTVAFSTPAFGASALRAAPAPSMVLQEPPNFVSEGAKTQVGNDAFLNEDLMGRAIRGTGVTADKKLKIGIVGAGDMASAAIVRHASLLKRVARVERIDAIVAANVELAAQGAIQFVLDEATVFVSVAGFIDLAAEQEDSP